MTIIAGAIGGVIVFAITPLVLRFASLSDGAMHYLKYMLLINTYYIMGSAVNTALIAGVFRAGGDTKFGLICDTIDMWVYAVPLGFFAAFVLKLPVLWVYFLSPLRRIPTYYPKQPIVRKNSRSAHFLNIPAVFMSADFLSGSLQTSIFGL